MAFTVTPGATVMPRPKGTTRETGSDTTTTGSFTEIVSYTPANGTTFSLAKILVTWSGFSEQQIRVKLDTEIAAEYHSYGDVADWFTPGFDLEGDGTKKVVIEAQGTDTAATLTGFIVGE